jgi:hypothetical protein
MRYKIAERKYELPTPKGLPPPVTKDGSVDTDTQLLSIPVRQFYPRGGVGGVDMGSALPKSKEEAHKITEMANGPIWRLAGNILEFNRLHELPLTPQEIATCFVQYYNAVKALCTTNEITAPTEIDLTEAFYVQLAARKVASGLTVESAVAEAKKNPPPPEAGIYAEDEPRHLLVCVCYWLSTLKPNRRFYLSCHDAEKHLKFHKHSKWALIFKGLCNPHKPTHTVLRLISQGGCFDDGRKASVYEYLDQER